MRAFLAVAVATILLGQIASLDAQPYQDGRGPGMMGPGRMGPGMMGWPYGRPPANADSPGAAVFQQQCAMCHVLQAGVQATFGPNLHGLFGRKSGQAPGFAYSDAMRGAGIVWDAQTLDRFLAAPQQVVPNNKMPFPGLPDRNTREKLIAYLKAATK